VANALAAVAALVGSGQAPGAIAQALQGFACSSEANPLRLNVFQLGEVRLVVDYAHNLAAYRALIDTCRGLGSGRLVGVVSAPGDRRDRELQEIGEACAQGFDEIVIYEINEDRGRPQGATARVLAEGAQRTGRPASVEVDLCRALRQALQRCQPGDTLVYACATHLSDLQAAFGHLSMAEERASGGPALRLAWSSEPLRGPVGEAERLQELDGAAAARRALLPRRQDPA
jgi:cyanophycin synthetase